MFWGNRQRPLQPTDPLLYELVELRRQQFDGLIWQVPALTFAGQAFIFTVLLDPDTRWWARIIAGILSVGISFLALLLIARHRQAEEMTSRWLSKQEADWPAEDRQHGTEWRNRRNKILPGLSEDASETASDSGRRTGWGFVPLANGYKTWVVALWLLILMTIVATVAGVSVDFYDAAQANRPSTVVLPPEAPPTPTQSSTTHTLAPPSPVVPVPTPNPTPTP